MIRIFSVAGLAALLAGGVQSPSSPSPTRPATAAAPQRDFRWSGRLASGERLQIQNVVGDIRAEPADGDQVTVTGIRRGRGAEDVRIEVVRRRDAVVICALWPSDWSDDGYRGRRSRDDDDDDDFDGDARDACNGSRNVHREHNDASVDFVVRVPAGVRLVARTVAGEVVARGLRGPVNAASVSGDVRVATSGPAQASSVSGNVDVSMGRMGSEPLAFHSVSGDVSIEVPAGFDADFHARTLSGSINSDFPLEVESERHGPYRVRIGREAHGTIGRGGRTLSVTTVSGDVEIRRR
ncbi:MAG TPA: DUF4097 family beta strand repeat-containing protein [Longimicrobiaceae bacterium]